MSVLSLGRDAIFVRAPKIAFQINGFPDFYALLNAPRDAGRAQLETAITSRAADLLAASFSRGGKSEFLTLLERHLSDFRPVLLDKVARLAYDEQLRRHENGDERALSFETWQQRDIHTNRLSRGIQTASKGLKARFKAAFWDSQYF